MEKNLPKKNFAEIFFCQNKMFAKKNSKKKYAKKIHLLENIKFTKKQGQSKMKARSRQCKHNLDLNLQFSGF